MFVVYKWRRKERDLWQTFETLIGGLEVRIFRSSTLGWKSLERNLKCVLVGVVTVWNEETKKASLFLKGLKWVWSMDGLWLQVIPLLTHHAYISIFCNKDLVVGPSLKPSNTHIYDNFWISLILLGSVGLLKIIINWIFLGIVIRLG